MMILWQSSELGMGYGLYFFTPPTTDEWSVRYPTEKDFSATESKIESMMDSNEQNDHLFVSTE